MTVMRIALLSEELESLRQLASEAILKHIPILHGKRLVHCGYASIRAGVPIITTMGRAKLAFEITRANWLVAPA
jgi:hypothetical protein